MALFLLVCSRVSIMLFIDVPGEAGLPGKLDLDNPTAGKGAPEEGQVSPLRVVLNIVHTLGAELALHANLVLGHGTVCSLPSRDALWFSPSSFK